MVQYTIRRIRGRIQAKLTAVSQNSNAKLVYTTDGTAPTAKSKQVASGSTINIDETCTLKVGLLSNGTVTGIRTYNYTIKHSSHIPSPYMLMPNR